MVPDVVILDLILPDMDGLNICKIIKENSATEHVPILMLTARAEVLDRVKGLESGADDYLVKPFDTLELLARVKVLLRRGAQANPKSRIPIKIGEFEIDPGNYTFHINGKSIDNLTPREFDILYLLMRNSPEPVKREDIYKDIWGSDKGDSRVIDIHIAKIRKKLGQQFFEQIKTIPAKGYLFTSR